MTQYKFEQFNEPINCNTWELMQVLDGNKGDANVTILMTDTNGEQYGVDLGVWKYDSEPNMDWNKTDLNNWIVNKLKTFES